MLRVKFPPGTKNIAEATKNSCRLCLKDIEKGAKKYSVFEDSIDGTAASDLISNFFRIDLHPDYGQKMCELCFQSLLETKKFGDTITKSDKALLASIEEQFPKLLKKRPAVRPEPVHEASDSDTEGECRSGAKRRRKDLTSVKNNSIRNQSVEAAQTDPYQEEFVEDIFNTEALDSSMGFDPKVVTQMLNRMAELKRDVEELKEQNSNILDVLMTTPSMSHNNDTAAGLELMRDKITTPEEVEDFNDKLSDKELFKSCVAAFQTKLEPRLHVAVCRMMEMFLEPTSREYFTAQGQNTSKMQFVKFRNIECCILATTNSYIKKMTSSDYLKGLQLFFKRSGCKIR